jgi:hypothetical protein
MLMQVANRRPLPLPAWVNPFDRPTDGLKALVQHAHRVEQALATPDALPISVSTTPLPFGFILHSLLWATNLALIRGSWNDSLACMDLLSGFVSPVSHAGDPIVYVTDVFPWEEKLTFVVQTRATGKTG